MKESTLVTLNLQDQYDVHFQEEMEAYEIGLCSNLSRIINLSHSDQNAIVKSLLELACQCQHIRNITLGREALWELPRQWLIGRIESVAESLIQSNEDWEFRRLMEIYWSLDKDLAEKLAFRGQNSPNPDIKEMSQECLNKLDDPVARKAQFYWE